MRKLFFLVPALAALMLGGCAKKYNYDTVPGDPMATRIYTLDNGLKVFLTENHQEPRIQANVAVRVGGKNDPAETTGLAHYFEHLMFKGTEKFGTQDFAAEKPLLDEIERLFEVYRQTTDTTERKAIYHQIDSVSYEASKLAIPNEYDKLMAAIGADGTNAYTSQDVTCYVEDIPANQVDNWARIQADRFEHATIRGFHTELETVYEEKNMSLTKDIRKVIERVFAELFPSHPYGTQTVLGTQEHLKNPSITNIKNYHKTWYVPNNMAVCMSGDFDSDEVIAIIDKHFGGMKPNPNLPRLQFAEEKPITSPKSSEVLGLEAENIFLAWRFPGAAHPDAEKLELLSQVLFNGQAGLFDLNLMQQQKILQGFCLPYSLADYCAFLIAGYPKHGQSLDEVKDLLLGELAKLRAGDFDEALLEGILNTYRRAEQQKLENNSARATMLVDAFVNGSEWADEVGRMERLAKITKQDLVDFANTYLKDDNYVAVYKRQGADPGVMTIEKPKITPIFTNRDTVSAFLSEVQHTAVAPIEPKFVDFAKELTQGQTKAGVPLLYVHNNINQLFQLTYLFDMGTWHDRLLGTAASYLEYLGTDDMTPEQVKSEFFRMGCGFSVSSSNERTYVTVSGLAENMPQAVALFEKLLAHARVNVPIYAGLVADILKSRADGKANQAQNFSALRRYITWGPEITRVPLTTDELTTTDPQALVDRIKGLCSYKHRILYYGPATQADVMALLDREHPVATPLKDYPQGMELKQATTDDTQIFIAPYDANQIYMSQFSNRGEKFDPSIEPIRTLYSEYFGGGMNGIVFQEMREARGLAYSASARLVSPDFAKYPYNYVTTIATQNDKMTDAIDAFNIIINDIPQSPAAFRLAKEGIIARLRTQRTFGSSILWSYIDAQDMGLANTLDAAIYEKVQTLTLEDVVKFQQEWVRGRAFHYGILGDKTKLDMDALRKMGPVTELTTEQIFGY